MLSLSRTAAREMGMIPFYMYRQKNMLGNHENVSYCRPGCESPYNIHIMEEDQTIFAFGAGGVSKLSVPVPDAEPNILRSFNVKSVEDYLARSREMASASSACCRRPSRGQSLRELFLFDHLPVVQGLKAEAAIQAFRFFISGLQLKPEA